MTKTAWVFPGQGSQVTGMGMDLLEIPTAKAKFEQAGQILGWSVAEVCQGPEDKLSHTLYTQPCLFVVSAILADLLQAGGHQPDLVAGHSLGEYVALYVASVFSFETGLQLVKQRAQLMSSASGGCMRALIGFDRSGLEAAVANTPEVVLANDNHATQVVISGTQAAIDQVLTQLKVKRVVPLNVSGAFHSPLMAAAATQFQQVLDSVPFQTAQVPVLSNVEPTPAIAAEVLKDRLVQQMTGPVRWREISLQLSAVGIERVIEIGPGQVLTGLIKRTCPDLALANIARATELPASTR